MGENDSLFSHSARVINQSHTARKPFHFANLTREECGANARRLLYVSARDGIEACEKAKAIDPRAPIAMTAKRVLKRGPYWEVDCVYAELRAVVKMPYKLGSGRVPNPMAWAC